MAHLVSGLLGVIAASLALTGAHLEIASGHDLGPAQRGDAGVQRPLTPDSDVNRAAKSDRDTVVIRDRAGSRTMLVQLDNLPSTSILVRVPLVAPSDKVDGRATPARSIKGPIRPTRAVVACEPTVSVLTEVAKLLEPGRCVT